MINQHDPGVINHPGYYPLDLYIPFCRNQCGGTPISTPKSLLGIWGNLGQVMGTAQLPRPSLTTSMACLCALAAPEPLDGRDA